jgi:hypothetical protein
MSLVPHQSTTAVGIARTAEDLTPEWFDALLQARGSVRSVEVEPVGTGQMSSVLRVALEHAGDMPSSLIVKLASRDAVARQTGLAMGFYEAEIRFYREVAKDVSIAVPACHYAEFDPQQGWFTLVMEDRPAAQPGDMMSAGTVARAGLALDALVGLQTPLWSAARLRETSWLQPTGWLKIVASFPAALDPFLVRFGEHLSPEEIALCERTVPHAVAWHEAWDGPVVVQHGDFRPDNVLFETGPDGQESLTVFDWQTTRVGPPLVDVAYCLGGSLSIEHRRAGEQELVRAYHAGLVAAGIADYEWERCWEDYRRYSLYGLLGFVGTSGHVQMTERGAELYLVAFRRFAAQALDLEADRFLP